MRNSFVLSLILVFLVIFPAIGAAQSATPVIGSGDFSGLVDIGGGRRLYLECHGSGSPTVVLEAGYRSPASVWTDDLFQIGKPMVLPQVATFTRVCTYERPGVAALIDNELLPSRSDPVPMPRTAQSVVADLHSLLHVAGVPGPYVLVGHSLGGLFVRLYASTYPDDVAGLVLVDAWYEGLRTLLTPDEWDAYVQLNYATPPELDAYHDLETLDFSAASDAVSKAAALHPLQSIPLFVLSKGQSFGISEKDLGFSPEKLDQSWAKAQQELATLLPDARSGVATESGHYIQLQQPELVIEAIRAVVEAVRDPASWDTPQSTPVSS